MTLRQFSIHTLLHQFSNPSLKYRLIHRSFFIKECRIWSRGLCTSLCEKRFTAISGTYIWNGKLVWRSVGGWRSCWKSWRRNWQSCRIELDALADDLWKGKGHDKSDTANDIDYNWKTYSLGESLSFPNEYDISFYEVTIERLNDR